MSNVCKHCGFRTGDNVRMQTALTWPDGTWLHYLHGVVEPWTFKGVIVHGIPAIELNSCHGARWKETGSVTPLPKPGVELDMTHTIAST